MLPYLILTVVIGHHSTVKKSVISFPIIEASVRSVCVCLQYKVNMSHAVVYPSLYHYGDCTFREFLLRFLDKIRSL